MSLCSIPLPVVLGKEASYDCYEGCPIEHCDYYASLVSQFLLQQKENEGISEQKTTSAASSPKSLASSSSTNSLNDIVLYSDANRDSLSPTSTQSVASFPDPCRHSKEEALACFFASIAPTLTLTSLSCALDKVFTLYSNCPTRWPLRKQAIELLLERVQVSQQELEQFVHISPCLPYTRNLVATDALHYTILLLCWPAGKESKVHNHPCDGCFVKSIQGQVRETKYVETEVSGPSPTGENTVSSESDPKRSMRVISDLILSPGQVTYMDDFIGYHKVGNAAQESSEEFAITLHVYTPPYQSCKVWASPDNAEEFFTGTVCSYSEYGRVVCTAAAKADAAKDKSGCSWNNWYI